MIYLSGSVRKEMIGLAPNLGFMLQPGMGNRPNLSATWFAIDTGCYAKPESFDLACYLAYLCSWEADRARCLFRDCTRPMGKRGRNTHRGTADSAGYSGSRLSSRIVLSRWVAGTAGAVGCIRRCTGGRFQRVAEQYRVPSATSRGEGARQVATSRTRQQLSAAHGCNGGRVRLSRWYVHQFRAIPETTGCHSMAQADRPATDARLAGLEVYSWR